MPPALVRSEPKGSELWLRALLTVRTEDWHFLKTVLFFFLKTFPRLEGAGDATGLGQIGTQRLRTLAARPPHRSHRRLAFPQNGPLLFPQNLPQIRRCR